MENMEINTSINELIEEFRLRFQEEEVDYYALAIEILDKCAPLLSELKAEYGDNSVRYQNMSNNIGEFAMRCYNKSLSVVYVAHTKEEYILLLNRILAINPKRKTEQTVKQQLFKLESDTNPLYNHATYQEAKEAVLNAKTLSQIDRVLESVIKWEERLRTSEIANAIVYNSYVEPIAKHILQVTKEEISDENVLVSFKKKKGSVKFEEVMAVVHRRVTTEEVDRNQYLKYIEESGDFSNLSMLVKINQGVKFMHVLLNFNLAEDCRKNVSKLSVELLMVEKTLKNSIVEENARVEEGSPTKWILRAVFLVIILGRLLYRCSNM